jgi:cell division protein FtsI/penicillin-binding protein 2
LNPRTAFLAAAAAGLLVAHLARGADSSARPESGEPARTSSKTQVGAQPPTRVAPTQQKTSRKKTTRRRTARRSPWRVSSYADPTVGDDPTGEDPLIRTAAVEALGNLNGAVVVVDPNTGRILSIVNQKLALSGAFTPCSTFKPVVAIAALKEGLVTPEKKVPVGQKMRMSMSEAMAKSNNPYFSRLGRQLGFEKVSEYAREFGLGERAGLDIPGESPGRFPEAPPAEGGVGMLCSFGRDIGMTPLQLAAVTAAIANGGTLYWLQYPRSPEAQAAFQPKVRRYLDGLSEYFDPVRDGLAAAVLYGTGRPAFDPLEQVYGKTGTCSEDGARLGWFASYANEREPKYVVVVLLRGGRPMYGPFAAEVAGRVYRALREREALVQYTPAELTGAELYR